MVSAQITASDIENWNSLEDIAASFEKRGLKALPDISDENRLVLELAEGEFIELVHAAAGKSATDYRPESVSRHTNLVATDEYETFTFVTRVRDWDTHGRIKYQQFSFEKDQFRHDRGEKQTVLQKLNEIEYGKSAAVYDDLYDTRKIVTEFYEQFESLRTDLVQEVDGIPEGRGDAKQRYMQVLLDRMIFLYFIQEKNLLDYNGEYLHSHHERIVGEGNDVYADFYERLFFDLLAEGKNDPEFGKLPYLNGGLFSKNPIEEEFEDAKLGASTEETNELFGRILDFLSDWNWNVDERLDIVDPKNLSPAVLGHIFEQTVNQKEMGAYYTPEEITGFMARRTIHPYLLDQLNEREGTEYESIDDVFSLSAASAASGEGEAIADGGVVAHEVDAGTIEQDHVETLYFDVLKEIRVLDPAVGSGAFLLAAQEVLLDVYLQCIEYFTAQAETEPWELTSRIKDELDVIDDSKGSETLYAKREIILNNLYGVDIDEGAVEICKLRLWLSMVADIEDEPGEVEPLPNIDFNIRQGNSLIGFTELIEVNQDGDTRLSNYGGGADESVQEKYESIIEAIENHREAKTGSEAAKWRTEAERRLSDYRNDLNEKVLQDFRDAGMDGITQKDVDDHSPFHWVLEFARVYADGGFDIIIGNPPWDVVAPNRDDYFTKFDEVFRTRGPSDKDQKQDELLGTPSIAEGWDEYQEEMKTRATYFNKNSQYELQDPQIEGSSVGNENDLSMLFQERVFKLASDDSYVAQILPGTVFVGAAGKDLRTNLLNETTVESLVLYENKGIFPEIDNRYKFGISVFKNSGKTEELKSIYRKGDLGALLDIDDTSVTVPREVLTKYSPKAGILPLVDSQAQVDLLSTIIDHPPLGDRSQGWYINPYSELHRNGDRDRYVESEEEGDYPVYGGSNIYKYTYTPDFIDDIEPPTLWSVDEERDPDKSAKRRVREKSFRSRDPEMGLKKAIYNEFDGTGSQKGFVNDLLERERGEPLSLDDVLLDCSEYRLVFRNIAQPTDERTFICSAIPKGRVCHHAVNTIRPYTFDINRENLSDSPLHSVYERVFSDQELFVALGLLNSIPFDYLMRRKIDKNLVMYKLVESQVPRLTDGDSWFHYISERAAHLNCYGDAFGEMRERLGGIEPATDEDERQRLQAEIDAAAFHAYGLDRRDTEFMLDDFHRVRDPRIMTEEYFDLVFEKYDELAETGPHP